MYTYTCYRLCLYPVGLVIAGCGFCGRGVGAGRGYITDPPSTRSKRSKRRPL